MSLTTCALRACPFGIRANNLQPKLKQLSVVLTTVDTTKQGVGRAECIEAIGEDYATCAVGREAQSHPIPFEFPTFQHWHIEIWKTQRQPIKKDSAVYHTAYGKRWLFALRAALLQISVSQTNGATRNNYATGLGYVRTSLFARFVHAAVAVGVEPHSLRPFEPILWQSKKQRFF